LPEELQDRVQRLLHRPDLAHEDPRDAKPYRKGKARVAS
jgi:hypothetical protein